MNKHNEESFVTHEPISHSQPTKRNKLKSSKEARRSSYVDDDPPLSVFCAEIGRPIDSLRCDMCQGTYHLTCCQIDIDNHSDLLSLTNFLGWTCQACRFVAASNLADLKKSIIDLSTELNNLRASIPLAISSCDSRPVGMMEQTTCTSKAVDAPVILDDHPNSRRSPVLTTARPDRILYSDILKLVNETIAQSDRRKLNLIVSGLAE